MSDYTPKPEPLQFLLVTWRLRPEVPMSICKKSLWRHAAEPALHFGVQKPLENCPNSYESHKKRNNLVDMTSTRNMYAPMMRYSACATLAHQIKWFPHYGSDHMHYSLGMSSLSEFTVSWLVVLLLSTCPSYWSLPKMWRTLHQRGSVIQHDGFTLKNEISFPSYATDSWYW